MDSQIYVQDARLCTVKLLANRVDGSTVTLSAAGHT
jgi:hypothetical protein